MCVEVELRESHKPLQFSNRYVGTGTAGDMGETPPELASGVTNDLTSAFGVLESAQFASLHVTRVSAQIQARRGLQEASIVSAGAPRSARAGRRVTIHGGSRYRSAMRTLSFGLRIPADAHREVTVSLQGPRAPSGHWRVTDRRVVDVLTFSAGGGASSPGSIGELRRQFHSIASSTVCWRTSRPRTVRAYRDPNWSPARPADNPGALSRM